MAGSGIELLAGVATLSFIIVSGVIGTRLLLLARRTRQVPELSIGLAMLLVVFLGYPLTLGATLPGLTPGAAKALFAAGTLVTAFGSCFVFVFTRCVFRPEQVWAGIAVGLVTGTILLLAAVRVEGMAGDGVPVRFDADPLALLTLGIYTLGYFWTSLEAFRYHGMLRRRLAIGLADPVVANRFLLWAISGASATIGLVVPVTLALLGDASMGPNPVGMLTVGLAGMTSTVSTYLAFMPPAVWVRWVGGSATA